MSEISGTTASVFTKCSHPEHGDSTLLRNVGAEL